MENDARRFAISNGSLGVFSPIGDRGKLNTGGQPVQCFSFINWW